jgi:cytochrome c553
MPGWSGEGRDDEVWALVAFLEELPGMDEKKFGKLVGNDRSSLIDFGKRQAADLVLCVSCHGDKNSPPVSYLVPVLQGQSAAYLRRALEEYRNDKRQSGIMEPIAAALDGDMIAEAARAYSGMEVLAPTGEINPEAVARGRKIARHGVADKQIPACLACHSGHASDQFPALSGLSAEYIESQLEIFHKGVRDQTAYGAIMTTIAQRLSPSQIKAAAAYFSSLPVGAMPPSADEEARRR